MIPGTGTINDYGDFISNCTLGQLPYKIPVSSLNDVQLYIDIGVTKPSTILYELIHTCGPNAGMIETLATSSYVIGQNKSDRWYGVFKNLTGATDPNCFVIAITLDSNIYFSEEYCIETCDGPTSIEGCYGNLDPLISTDCNGIYFGVHAGTDTPLGDSSIVYRHKVFMRGIEVTTSGIKNTYRQGRTRTFRTERDKLFLFWSEIIPEWYLDEVDAVMFRGEVNIDGTRYLLNETAYEKVDECLKQWKPSATFKESCYQSFSCETDPCAEPPEECCDPVILSATTDIIGEESQDSGFPPTTPDEIAPTIVVHAVVDGIVVVTGTTDPVTGIASGNNTITCAGFAGVRVLIMRGTLPLPGIDPGGGADYYTKALGSATITLNSNMVANEFIYIETIPF